MEEPSKALPTLCRVRLCANTQGTNRGSSSRQRHVQYVKYHFRKRSRSKRHEKCSKTCFFLSFFPRNGNIALWYHPFRLFNPILHGGGGARANFINLIGEDKGVSIRPVPIKPLPWQSLLQNPLFISSFPIEILNVNRLEIFSIFLINF